MGPRGEVIAKNNITSFRFSGRMLRDVLAFDSYFRQEVGISAQGANEDVSGAEIGPGSAEILSAREILSSPDLKLFNFLVCQLDLNPVAGGNRRAKVHRIQVDRVQRG